jgi:hypothetical protein
MDCSAPYLSITTYSQQLRSSDNHRFFAYGLLFRFGLLMSPNCGNKPSRKTTLR